MATREAGSVRFALFRAYRGLASHNELTNRFLQLGGKTRNPQSGDLSRPIAFVPANAPAPPTTGRIYAHHRMSGLAVLPTAPECLARMRRYAKIMPQSFPSTASASFSTCHAQERSSLRLQWFYGVGERRRPAMKFLANGRLYAHTEECLQFLRGLRNPFDGADTGRRERYHLYWYGTFSLKQAFAVKSFLATQDLERSELWLWLDGERGYAGYQENRFLRPLLRFLQVKHFDPETEAQDTPLERRAELYQGVNLAARSDFFRFVVLYKHGGVYADMDTMFLRDLRILLRNPDFPEEFCYRWSAHLPCGNSAILRLQQHSNIGRALLLRCSEVSSCHPRKVLQFAENSDLDLLAFPCAFFDPLWPHYDHQDRYEMAPFHRFRDFFRRFGWWFRRQPPICSYLDFLPGAFAYQWHGRWGAPEYKNSYFGLFNLEFDHILQDRLAIALPDPEELPPLR